MSKSAIVRSAVEAMAERLSIPSDTAFEFYYQTLDEALAQNPKIVKELLGIIWCQEFEDAKERLSKTNEARRLRRQEKRLQAEKAVTQLEKETQRRTEEAQIQTQLSKVDLSALIADTQSGFKNIYRYGTGWRGRVKANGSWVFLPFKKTPEEAALQLYDWCQQNAPEELLPDSIRYYYTNYKQANPNSTHEEALLWAKDTCSTSEMSVDEILDKATSTIENSDSLSTVNENGPPELLEDGFPPLRNN